MCLCVVLTLSRSQDFPSRCPTQMSSQSLMLSTRLEFTLLNFPRQNLLQRCTFIHTPTTYYLCGSIWLPQPDVSEREEGKRQRVLCSLDPSFPVIWRFCCLFSSSPVLGIIWIPEQSWELWKPHQHPSVGFEELSRYLHTNTPLLGDPWQFGCFVNHSLYSRSHSGKEALMAGSRRSLRLNHGGLIRAILRGLLRAEIPRSTHDFLNQNH